MDKEKRDHYVKLFRNYKFNCFPIPARKRIADKRYNAARTELNQPITNDENYGIIPILGAGNCIIDFDNKEQYREFAEHMISKKYMVIETGRGWHVPVIGLSGEVTKIELFDYKIDDKKIIEIQGPNHYCVGVGSVVDHEKLHREVIYENKGVDETIWNAKGIDFHELIDQLCKACGVIARKKKSRSSYKYLRERFLEGKTPLKGTSNDFYHQAAIQCNTDGLSIDEAHVKIRENYDKWSDTGDFSHRPWSNIEEKIRDAYENNKVIKEGRPKKEDDGDFTTDVVEEMITTRKLYSNEDTKNIYENTNGFLERINNSLQRELQPKYPSMEPHEYKSILFKLVGKADVMPITNKNLIKFKNMAFDKKTKTTVETEDIADIGFKNYNYLPKSDSNIPVEFEKIMFSNVSEKEHPRIKAGLRAIFQSYVDPKISLMHGSSGVGKSTGLTILIEVLGPEYGMIVELDQLINDKFIRAKIEDKLLLVFQDMPKSWRDFSYIKNITGESRKTERGFQQDSVTFDNKLKIWGSGNYLTKIPKEEQNAMYTRRLSLIHNIRTLPYKEDPELIDRVVNNEGEKIVSWILNFTDEECEYEHPKTVKAEWESLASPEIEYLQTHYEVSMDEQESPKSVGSVLELYKKETSNDIEFEDFVKVLKSLGYAVWGSNQIKNMVHKAPPPKLKNIL